MTYQVPQTQCHSIRFVRPVVRSLHKRRSPRKPCNGLDWLRLTAINQQTPRASWGSIQPGRRLLCGRQRSSRHRYTRGDELTVAVELLIDESKIRERLGAMGRQIENDYRDKPLTIVAVLTGSLIALADLVRQIRIPLRIALLQASSYRGTRTSATTLVINEAFAPDVVGRDVLLLDDILDTGQTLGALVDHLKDRGANSVRTAVLLRKIGRQVVPLEPDYCGFVIPDAFVVGYGLDYNDEYRHLPYVGVLRE